ncbi:dTMP kinase [Staphylospora marina]|uniref:dTMP kinase n=1 Tax=Staphylospora marina TaxID=2490858 RepID=UPI000F5B9499|nr:dTMP kinase [Staphylospora marina]
MRGRFITLEGPEGAGKTTQIQKIREKLRERGVSCTVVREPGGTRIGDRVREILLSPEFSNMCQRTEILLYASSRAQLVEEVIRPALERGEWVLCDRYVDSSLAYQGYGAMWDLEEVKIVNRIATGGLVPDRTYLLDIPVETGRERLRLRGKKKDRMEMKEKLFHERVRQGYLTLAEREPHRFRVVDGTKTPDEVHGAIMRDLFLWAGI